MHTPDPPSLYPSSLQINNMEVGVGVGWGLSESHLERTAHTHAPTHIHTHTHARTHTHIRAYSRRNRDQLSPVYIPIQSCKRERGGGGGA